MSSLRWLVIGGALLFSAGAGRYAQACGCTCSPDPVFIQHDRRSAQDVAKAQSARAVRLQKLRQKLRPEPKKGTK